MHVHACQYFSGKKFKIKVLPLFLGQCDSPGMPSDHCVLARHQLIWALLTSAGMAGGWSLHWAYTPTRRILVINQVILLCVTVQSMSGPVATVHLHECPIGLGCVLEWRWRPCGPVLEKSDGETSQSEPFGPAFLFDVWHYSCTVTH